MRTKVAPLLKELGLSYITRNKDNTLIVFYNKKLDCIQIIRKYESYGEITQEVLLCDFDLKSLGGHDNKITPHQRKMLAPIVAAWVAENLRGIKLGSIVEDMQTGDKGRVIGLLHDKTWYVEFTESQIEASIDLLSPEKLRKCLPEALEPNDTTIRRVIKPEYLQLTEEGSVKC